MVKTTQELGLTEIEELVKTKIDVFEPDDTVSKILGELEKNGGYEAIVETDTKIGLITIRDILKVDQPNQTKLTKFWKPLSPVTTSDVVKDVAHELIERNIRALPVVKNQKTYGLISQVDFVNALIDCSDLSSIPAKNIARITPITIDASEKVIEARNTMLLRGFSHIPVIKNEKVVGIITAKDLVHTFIVPAIRIGKKDFVVDRVSKFPGNVSDVMDKHPAILGLEATTYEVVKELYEREKSACLILNEQDKLYGIITPRELLPLVAGTKTEEEYPIYIMGLNPEDFLERSLVESKVRRTIQRGRLIHKDINEVLINIKKKSREGNRTRYELRGRVLSPTKEYNVSTTGWDLLIAFDRLLESLDGILRQTKPEPIEKRRRRGRGRS
ncbi:CBS domain-containing protein [Candidatus Bathyarchaeota archaeon]|nr:CBS domain-containing protein [Candidatus Bathyarchaeota archaeon]